MRLPNFQYHTPKTLNALHSLINKYGKEASIMAGGTEFLPRLKYRLVRPKHIVSILNIKELENIKINENGETELGAAIRVNDIEGFFKNNKQFSAISDAASLIASQQIRNMATVGGNILQDTRCMFYNRSWQWQKTVPPCYKRGGNLCHAVKNSKRCFAVYQSDLAPTLIALDAKCVFFLDNQFTILSIEKMFTGDGTRPLKIDNAILIKILLPKQEDGWFSTYKKYRLRGGLDFPLAGVAIAIKCKQKKVYSMKLCITGVSSSPVVIKISDELVYGKKIDENLAVEIAKKAFSQVHPVDNLEANRETRRLMVKQMTYEGIKELTGKL